MVKVEWKIYQGDALAVLQTLPNESIHCCVTSPPYYGLRDYGTATWEGGSGNCDHKRLAYSPDRETPGGRGGSMPMSENPYRGKCGKCGAIRIDSQLGLENSPDEYVARLMGTFHEVKRVLRSDGSLWLNLGDSYAGGGNNHGNGKPLHPKQASNRGAQGQVPPRAIPANLKPKDLIGIPWAVAFALRADGWYLRSDIIWSKSNPMPESVTDRPTRSHEYMFLLSKSGRYYYDAEAIKEPGSLNVPWSVNSNGGQKAKLVRNDGGNEHGLGKPARQDKQRGHSRRHAGFNDRWDAMSKEEQSANGRNKRSVWNIATQPYPEAHFATFPEGLIRPCILAGSPEGGTVLDCFSGSGTTGVVATQENRNYIGIELNAEYIAMSERRIEEANKQGRLFQPQATITPEMVEAQSTLFSGASR